MSGFDPRMRCRTIAGHPVEILTVLPPEKCTEYGETIVALVHLHCGRSVMAFLQDGTHRHEPTWSLENIPIPVVTVAEYEALTARERAERKQYVTQTAAKIRAVVVDAR